MQRQTNGNNISFKQKRKVKQAVKRYQGDGLPHTVQDTLPFEKIYPDGICKLSEGKYSRCIEFADINYRLVSEDRQKAICQWLRDLYNSYDSSVNLQLSLMTRRVHPDTFHNQIELAAQEDPFDDLRAVYSDMLWEQFQQGTHGIIQTSLLIITVEATDMTSAKEKLHRLVADTLNRFRQIGSVAVALDGKAWLELLHSIFHPDGERFQFSWNWIAASGASQKDYITPTSFRFGTMRNFFMGGKYCTANFLRVDAHELSDQVLTDLLDTDGTMIVSLHFHSVDQQQAIKGAKRAASDLDSIKINNQKRAVREGYDMDIMATDVLTMSGEAKNIVHDLENRNEKLFLVTLLVVHIANSKRQLRSDIMHTEAIAARQRHLHSTVWRSD